MFSKIVNKINSVIDNPKVEYKAITKGKTINQIIEEIHENFYTEVDRLLAEAKITKSLETTQQDLIDKCSRLRALGFTNTKEVKEAQIEISRLSTLSLENQNKARLIEAIDYFSFNYPQYKFITEDSVKKICQKYNLIYGTIDKYIGTVPDTNIKQMEQFKVKDCDKLCEYGHVGFGGIIRGTRFISEAKAKEHIEPMGDSMALYERWSRLSIELSKLEIAAPISDFNTEGMELKDFKLSNIEIPDPVVLCPVLFKDNKYYLVVTAWGLEGSDELVVNQKMN